MFDPFRLFFKLVIALFKIAGYTLAYGSQAVWYVFHGRRDLVGDAIGELGRGITDVIADIGRK